MRKMWEDDKGQNPRQLGGCRVRASPRGPDAQTWIIREEAGQLTPFPVRMAMREPTSVGMAEGKTGLRCR